MFSLIALFFFVGVVAILAYAERKISCFKWRGLSPFVLLAVPYTAVLFIQVYSIAIYNLTPLCVEYLGFLLIHLIIAWLVCVLFEGQVQNSHPTVSNVKANNYDDHLRIILAVGVVVSAVQVFHFFASGQNVSIVGQVVQEDFQQEYSGGVYFYLRLMSMLCAAYLIAGLSRKRILLILPAVFCLLPVFLTFVKSVVILSLVAGVIGNIVVNERRIRIKDVAITVLLGFAVFFGVYLVEICIWDLDRLTDPETYSYIFAKMNFYFISAPQSFNMVIGNEALLEGFRSQAQDNLVLAPLMNIMHWVGLADRVETACPVWTFMGFIPGYGAANGNVYSIIGQYVLYCGTLGSVLANVFFTSIVSYFYCAYHVTGNPFQLVIYGMLGGFFCMGWFDDYFCQTFWVYMMVMFGALYLVSRFLLSNMRDGRERSGQVAAYSRHPRRGL